MRLLFYLVLLCGIAIPGYSQTTSKGEVIVRKFMSPAIKGNHGGEDPQRRLSIYLPPGYNDSKQHYPVIYFLHGFLLNDSLQIVYTSFNELLDTAIATGVIKPVIVVFPNSDTRFKGSFYTNSTLTGEWADYIGKDVVSYIDKNFRTIPDRNSRGLAGHSMGGNGALKVGMLYPKVFGSVYSLSPAVLGWGGELSLDNPAMKRADTLKTESLAFKILSEPMNNKTFIDFFTLVMLDLGRTYSPDEKKLPFQAVMPATYIGDSVIPRPGVVKKWNNNFTLNMIAGHADALRSLNALQFDWGSREENAHIPVTCKQLATKLDSLGIKYVAQEYDGGHIDKIGGMDGRIYSAVLPFFNKHLIFISKQ